MAARREARGDRRKPIGASAAAVRGVSAGYGATGRGAAAGHRRFCTTSISTPRRLGGRRDRRVGLRQEHARARHRRPAAGRRGTIALDGRRLPARRTSARASELRDIQIVFQMADTALNPAHTIGRILGRPAALFDGLAGDALERRASRELLDMVQLPADSCRALSARALGRTEAARQSRPRARRQPEADPLRRGDVEPRHRRRRGDPEAAGGPAPPARPQLPVHQSRPVDRARRLRRGRRALCRPARAGDAAQAIREPPMHPYVDLLVVLDPGAARRLARRAAGRGASSAAPATRRAGRPTGCAFFGRCGLALAGTCDAHAAARVPARHGAVIACHRSEAGLLAAQRTSASRHADRTEIVMTNHDPRPVQPCRPPRPRNARSAARAAADQEAALKNRIMSTSHASTLDDGGMPSERYQRYHEEKAKGGLALTMFGGSSMVAPDSSWGGGQVSVASDDVIPHLQQFSDRIHAPRRRDHVPDLAPRPPRRRAGDELAADHGAVADPRAPPSQLPAPDGRGRHRPRHPRLRRRRQALQGGRPRRHRDGDRRPPDRPVLLAAGPTGGPTASAARPRTAPASA